MSEGSCFGYYTGEFKCKEGGCRLASPCKALVNTDGLDVASDVIDSLVEDLPVQDYCPTDSVRALLKQLLDPSSSAHGVASLKPLRPVTMFPPLPGPDPF